ncbi:Uncharacterized protein TCM_039394 [Theobroma cacao]|uniref:Uncharacterized protein n=1 Tax=Theobroma cacao TaxID=3641 RepID=A0A061GRF4_THECC|nr:Uncharacterized protein TCM_039394 [Theobroma cacao]
MSCYAQLAQKNDGLWFPSLIIALCNKVSVQWDSSEELLHSKVPIDVRVIYRYFQPSVGGNFSSVPYPRAFKPKP